MKNLTITPPSGYEIDKKQSTFENIVFKPLKKALPKTWEELKNIAGYCVALYSNVSDISNSDTHPTNRNIFATEQQAKACIALAQLSQLMAVYNDGWVPDWTDKANKYILSYQDNSITSEEWKGYQHFLSFKTEELRDEFLENFGDLILIAKPLL